MARDRRDPRITPNREPYFDLELGRFQDPTTGRIEEGSPPPDYDPVVDRFRGVDGAFKDRPVDYYDEPAEVEQDSLDPLG